MAQSDETPNVYLSLYAIRAAWTALRSQKAHNHFLGYLCLLEEASRQGRLSSLTPNFRSFFKRYFAAGGLPTKHPYLHPYSQTLTQFQNVAGSYAPSSLRPVAPMRAVASIDDDGTWTLSEKHPEIALSAMLGGQRMAAIPLSVFLYRDFAFVPNIGIPELLQVFRKDFGLTDKANFDKLFTSEYDFVGNLFEYPDAHG
jgi:hypothetical protein